MTQNFGSLVFTQAVKALQEKYGSRRQYGRLEGSAGKDRLGEDEVAYIAERDSFYMATTGATGWPYIQHRGGPVGFLKAIDERTLAFADFLGNKQYISAGNLATDDRLAMIMVDYPTQSRLKILGRARVFEGDSEWIERVRMPGYKARIERVLVIAVEAFDWNCQQHITPRFTAKQIQDSLEPLDRRMKELEEENTNLRAQLELRDNSVFREGE
ncbi:MAG: pyridoxamine 5'-phosphate oxidase family protein [Terriglobia bacterium]